MQDQHFAAIRRRLGQLRELEQRTDAADAKIRAAADARRAQVQADLTRLAPRVHLDTEAGDRYQALIDERRHLDRVLG